MEKAVLQQLNIVVSDFARSADFYRRIGLTVAEPLANASRKPFHATGEDAGGMTIEFDSAEFAKLWNPGWAGLAGLCGRVVLGFACPSRADVDRIFRDLIDAGHASLAPPHDAFWGSRYAIVEDPDGIAVGLMSAADAEHRAQPPAGWGA